MEVEQPVLTAKQRKKQRYKENRRRRRQQEETKQREELQKAMNDAVEREQKKQEEQSREKKFKDMRALFKAKLGEKRIQRSSKATKERVLEQTLKQIGIDKEKFKADMEAVKKQGGLEINLKN